MGATLKPAGSTCTTINEDPQYAQIPPGNKGYLQEKVEYALRMPKVVYIRAPDGTTTVNLLKQVAMTVAIRIDETLAHFHWQYKAEVSFDMMPYYASRGVAAPIPFLSADKSQGPGRRHSLNPFPPGMKPGFLRRPDVIIVKNLADRWPGRGAVDADGAAHVDNMLRLIEVKFPGDSWGAGQEQAYQIIAGDFKNRMSVIDVSDCDGELEKARQRALASIPAPQPATQEARKRVPIRSAAPIPETHFYEDWWTWVEHKAHDAGAAVAPVWDAVHSGYTYVSSETSAFLHQHAPWIFTAGHWVAVKASDTWAWVDKQGKTIYSYTTAQLKAGWQEIVRTTDLTWELLKKIDWAQVGVTTLKVVSAVVVIVAAVAIVVLLAPALVAIFTALLAIIATAGAEAVAVLAVALGVGAVASAA